MVMARRGMSSREIAGNCHCCVLVVCFRDVVKQEMRKIGARGVQLAGHHEPFDHVIVGTGHPQRYAVTGRLAPGFTSQDCPI
jgi:hypothetical protein